MIRQAFGNTHHEEGESVNNAATKNQMSAVTLIKQFSSGITQTELHEQLEGPYP